MHSLLDVSSSKDLALLGSTPHVDLIADLASWNLPHRQNSWNSLRDHVIDLDAGSATFWWSWVDWHKSSVVSPCVVVESVPFSSSVLVGVAIVVPEATGPSPSSTESAF